MIDQSRILKLIQSGEGLNLEFKQCREKLNLDVYQTICAFLNRHGGTLLLGVHDSGKVTGIAPHVVDQIKKDFVTTINNPQKIQPPAYLSVDEVQVHDQIILHVYVPESSQVHRCNGRIFDRNEDGDFDITDHTVKVAELYQRKQAAYSENKVYPYAGLDDLRPELIEKCRRLAGVWRDSHPWLDMDDMELIQSAQLFQKDPETGKSGITLAGILLLGNDQVILSAVPHHRTDLILRKVNLDRYDDRDLVRTNLIESYERIMAFVQKHLPDPFHLEGTNRISIRDAIFREVASNILIHREYRNAFPAKLIIERGQVRTENSSKPHGFGVLDPSTFTPFPKNPVIGAFFREIHRADELGSGMRNMMKYGKAYGGEDPQMIEGDVFRIIVKVPEFGAEGLNGQQQGFKTDTSGAQSGGPQVTQQVTPQVTQQVTPQVKKLLHVLSGEMNRQELQDVLELKDRIHFRESYINPALKAGVIEMTQPGSPKSPTQKYRLTSKGYEELNKLK